MMRNLAIALSQLLNFIPHLMKVRSRSLNVFLQGRLERFKQPVAYYELPQDLIQGQ